MVAHVISNKIKIHLTMILLLISILSVEGPIVAKQEKLFMETLLLEYVLPSTAEDRKKTL